MKIQINLDKIRTLQNLDQFGENLYRFRTPFHWCRFKNRCIKWYTMAELIHFWYVLVCTMLDFSGQGTYLYIRVPICTNMHRCVLWQICTEMDFDFLFPLHTGTYFVLIFEKKVCTATAALVPLCTDLNHSSKNCPKYIVYIHHRDHGHCTRDYTQVCITCVLTWRFLNQVVRIPDGP